MATVFVIHQVKDAQQWANAWKKGPSGRHAMFARLGVRCQTFQDPHNPHWSGVLAHVPDIERFQEFLRSSEARQAMQDDGLKLDTLRVMAEFEP